MSKKMSQVFAFVLGLGLLLFSGCDIPTPQPYPYKPASEIMTQAQTISNNLEAYIRDWLAGRVPATIPDSVLPPAIYVNDDGTYDNSANYRLANPANLDPASFMTIKEAAPVDPSALWGDYNDPQYTYLITNTFAPFGSSTIIKGRFPHCRYMQITATAPINGRQYYWTFAGPPEIPIIDADIDPDPGHVNPFRVGANRNATNRNFTVTYLNKIADWGSTVTNPYCPKAPFYRSVGNTRYSAMIMPGGPGPNGPPAGYDMRWEEGWVWVRYALPDGFGSGSFDPYAGVGVPKIYHKLASGEEFMIIRTPYTYGQVPSIVNNFGTSDTVAPGWRKMFGILQSLLVGAASQLGLSKTYVHDFVRGVEGRAYDLPAPGNYEGSATCVNYCNYLISGTHINAGMVGVISGKLPTFPKTRDGQSTMTSGEMRYWSITANETPDPNDPYARSGYTTTTVYDEQLKLDANRNYVICFSRAADRPTNATTESGVTWIDNLSNSQTHWTWRWVSVSPDWFFSKTPSENRLKWHGTSSNTVGWDSPNYNNNLIGIDTRTGWLGQYQARIDLMSKASFQNMGSPVTLAKLDAKPWNDGASGGGCGSGIPASSASTGLLALLPLFVSIISLGFFHRRKRLIV